jgi:hypothetical protein
MSNIMIKHILQQNQIALFFPDLMQKIKNKKLILTTFDFDSFDLTF